MPTYRINPHPKDAKTLAALKKGFKAVKGPKGGRPPSRSIAGKVLLLGMEVHDLMQKGALRKKAVANAAEMYRATEAQAIRAYTIFCRSIGKKTKAGRRRKNSA